MKKITTIKITTETRDDLMLFKIKSKAKNIEEVIKRALELLREHNIINEEGKYNGVSY